MAWACRVKCFANVWESPSQIRAICQARQFEEPQWTGIYWGRLLSWPFLTGKKKVSVLFFPPPCFSRCVSIKKPGCYHVPVAWSSGKEVATLESYCKHYSVGHILKHRLGSVFRLRKADAHLRGKWFSVTQAFPPSPLLHTQSDSRLSIFVTSLFHSNENCFQMCEKKATGNGRKSLHLITCLLGIHIIAYIIYYHYKTNH